MKVALLGRYPLDTQRIFGGVEAAIVSVERALLAIADIELHTITCTEELSHTKVVERAGHCVTYLPRGRLGRVTWHRREVHAMLSALRDLRPEIVHAHSAGLYAGAALASPYPAVITVHGIFAKEAKLLTGWRNRLRGFLDASYERRVLRRAQHLIVINPYVEGVFAGVFSGRSYLVDNPCDEAFFEVRRQPVQGRLLLAGISIPRKGVLPLLRALYLVRKRIPEAHLRIAGSTAVDPDYFRACKAYVREAELGEAVTFLGHLVQEQIVQEYASSSALVMPSFQETAPIAIAQAMAAGLPVVATRAGGVPWMVEDGVTGTTLPVPGRPQGDPEALADALCRVLQDPEGAGEMAQRAKEVAERRFRPEVVARRTWEVYQRVIEATPTRA